MTDIAHPGPTAWSKDRIEALLRAEDFAYQNVPLPYGLSTGGHDRASTAEKVLPADLTGKTVLDLGCSFGYFCFEALKRGARRAVGIDLDPDSVRKARLLADCLNLPAEFEARDIEADPITEPFDYVLCLNLLHHLRNPLATLDDLIAITRERLVLEMATLGEFDRRKVGVSRLAAFFLSRAPILFVSRNGTRGKRQVQKFFFSEAALEHLLIYQRGMFARLDFERSPHKDRFIATAHKRRIGHLLVVAGPTSSGKKTVMRKLLDGELPQLAARLGETDGAAWGPPLNADRLWQPDEPEHERLMLHYDFLKPYLRSAMLHHRDEAMDVLTTARRVTFLTVWTPPERLVRQITAAEIEPRIEAGRERAAKRHRRIREDYQDAAKVVAHYRSWFAFTQTRSPDHVVVALENDTLRLYTVEEWEREVAAAYAPAR